MAKTLDSSTFFVIAGIICIVLAVIGNIGGIYDITIPEDRQLILGGLGIVFLVISQWNKIRDAIKKVNKMELKKQRRLQQPPLKNKLKGGK